jgi:hypothetical protein
MSAALAEAFAARLNDVAVQVNEQTATQADKILSIIMLNPTIAHIMQMGANHSDILRIIKNIEDQVGRGGRNIDSAEVLLDQASNGKEELDQSMVMNGGSASGVMLEDDAYPGQTYRDIDRNLWQTIAQVVNGHALSIAQNVGNSGFRAWRRLTKHFDPRSGADRSVHYERVTNPLLVYSRPKTNPPGQGSAPAMGVRWATMRSSTLTRRLMMTCKLWQSSR